MQPEEVFSIRVRQYHGDGEILNALETVLRERDELAAALKKKDEEIAKLQQAIKAVQTAQLGGAKTVD